MPARAHRIAGSVAVLGGGLMGCCAALALAARGARVVLFERRSAPLRETSRATEGKIHLGFVYAADRSFCTARLMQRGAAAFGPLLEGWLGPGTIAPLVSEPFVYAVHRRSQVPVTAIEAHFDAIRRDWTGPPGAVAWSRMPQAELERSFDPDSIEAVYRTGEVAIDAGRLADRVAAAVRAEPRIEVRANVSVASVEGGAGAFRIRGVSAGHACVDGPFGQVANCLWANRPSVDVASGLPPPAAVMTRHKLGIWLRPASPPPAELLSTTIVLGPFGDIVVWPDGLIYVSWYPACMIGRQAGLAQTDWRDIRAGIDDAAIVRATIDALGRLCPPLAAAVAGARALVDGGSIYALGETDIDDPSSRLHERSAVGLVASRPGYFSVDTGKFTLAPLLAEGLAAQIAGGPPPGLA